MNTVHCPHCQKSFELNEAFKHQIEEDILRTERENQKAQIAKLKQSLEQENEKRLKDEIASQTRLSQAELADAKKKSDAMQQELLELTRSIRALKERDEQRELELEKKLIAEREKIQESVSKTMHEKADLENAELRKQLDDTKKALEDAQRKAQQSSQQLQGEVLELDLELQLKSQFPTDEILPVPKGVEGADIAQKVRNKFGQTAGLILWETKRTKAWSNSWSSKLREDKRRMNASLAILVSDVLPDGIETFGIYENIWVASYQYALPLVNVLRIGLFELAVAKSTTANKDEKLEALFSYLANDGFRNRFEAQVESIIALRNDLESEQRSTIRMWKKREMQIKRLMTSVATMYGELQGVMGEALPSLPSLDSGLSLASRSEQDSLLE